MINRQGSQKKFLNDFVEVNNYISKKFPELDVSDIPIYLVSEEAMSANGFSGIGGFYVHHMRLIVVKNEITIGAGVVKRKIDAMLQKLTQAKIDIEDVIVHEMIHAVSGESNRSNRKFSFDEEEFVYTNSIDFYKQKGMTPEDIVNKNFIPFCIQDIFSNRKEFDGILSKLEKDHKVNVPTLDDMTQEALNRFLGRHAEHIAPIIVERAREIGFHMINLYDQYGRGVGAVKAPEAADSSIRFQTLDMNDEW